ncbi:MAG: hypothetical protein WHS38_10115 [Thermodesulforhabdaceae bacterium]
MVKKIKGSGQDKTAFFINSLIIDIPEEEVVEIESVTFKKVEDLDTKGTIIIRGGKAVFRNTIFEGIQLIAENKGSIKVENTLFSLLATDPAIAINDNAEIQISKPVKFEKVGCPLFNWFG